MKNNDNSARTSSSTSLHQHAEDNLKYIRDTMESAISFTGVSGKGYVVAGFSALAAAWLASRQATANAWLAVWMAELAFAATVSFTLTALKARKQGSSLYSRNGIRLLLAFIPGMAVGGIFTVKLYLEGDVALLPGIWLCLYGAAVMTAGVHSVRAIPVMGAIFIVLGVLVFFAPLPANTVLGLGMGIVHIVFGIIVWSNYGG